MTQTADEQGQRLEAAARSLAAKLQSFQDELTGDERRMLGLALGALAGGGVEADVAGYADTDPIGVVREWCLTWQVSRLPRSPYGVPLPPQPPPFV